MPLVRRIEVLFLEGCPNVDLAAGRARQAIKAADVTATVTLLCVRNEAEAQRLRFLGSPTLRVDGADVDLAAATRSDFGMQCRVYGANGRLEGAPPIEWIAAALRSG